MIVGRDLGDECDRSHHADRCGCEINEAFLGPDGTCVVCGYDW